MRPTVVLLLDALRWDYLSPEMTPFLYSAAQSGEYYRTVIPGPGFCERAELLTGRSVEDTGLFTAIGYDPNRSPYRKYRSLLDRLEWIEGVLPTGLPRRGLRRVIRALVGRMEHGFGPYWIPFSFLPYFTLTEDYWDHRDPRAFSTPSLISLVEESNGSVFYDSFTALGFARTENDKERLRIALSVAEQAHDLYLVYQGLPDTLGHRHGPDVAALRAPLRDFDRIIEEFTVKFCEKRPETRFVVLGDHGMHQVEHRIDIEAVILELARELSLERGRDFLYFLDSTMMRIWNLRDRAGSLLERLESHAGLSRFGELLDSPAMESFGIPAGDRAYGDLLWWANPGVLVCPDFFHVSDEKVKGMHGYDPVHPDSRGCCLVFGAGVSSLTEEEIRLTDVFSIVRNCLDV